MAFASKNLTNAETYYSNIEREELGILQVLENFHDYFFVQEVSMITDHKQLVAIVKRDVSSLSHRLQRILLWIQQYNTRILYMPGP